MHLRLPVLMAVAIACSACGFWPPMPSCDAETQACDEVWVTVTGPTDWPGMPQDYVLEVGEHGWPVGAGGSGGVVGVKAAPGERVVVRLVEPRLCVALVEFAALPGSHSVIRMVLDGTLDVEHWVGDGVEPGPALTEGQRTDCVFDT